MSNLYLIISFLFGIISATIAYKNKRNFYFWFLIGFLFCLLGVAILKFFINKDKKKSKINPEQVRYNPLLTPEADKIWYYLDKDEKHSEPMSVVALHQAFLKRKINFSTYVWNEEMENWKKIKDLPHLRKAIGGEEKPLTN